MTLKRVSLSILILLITVFIALLLIAIGVKYQEPLNSWNNRVIKGENESAYNNLYLNNYKPEVKIWHLTEKLGNKVLTTDQYGNEVFLGGLITGALIQENFINVAFNAGIILKLSKNGELLKRVNIYPILENFILKQSNGGVRSVVWLTDNLIFVYYTSQKPTEESFDMRAAIINISNLTVEDDIELGQFNLDEHFALGGGSVYDKPNNRILLAIGVASGPDNVKTSSKAQDNKSLFGKIVSIRLSDDQLKMFLPSILSKGHRNPQGMVIHNDLIFAVEHGPKGGDEINIIKENSNYGWNNFSYGTKYGKSDSAYINYSKKYLEPIFYFTPSIGISDIYQCPRIFEDPGYKGCLLISSMRAGSFYLAKLNKKMSALQSIEELHLGDRIRKIRSSNDAVYLFTDNQSVVKISYSKL